MYKYLGVFVLGGILGSACTSSNGSRVVATHNPVQEAPATTMAVDLPDEHVRHMRSHNRIAEIGEIPKVTQVSDATEQTKTIVDQTPTGSIKRNKPRKAKVVTHKKKDITGAQEIVAEQAEPVETEKPSTRGFFEKLFSGN
jgi:hypothetical protein